MLFRYIAREIIASSVLVLLALLALFFFFDLIRELDDLGRGNYRLTAMLGFVTLTLPTHAYVLLPAAGLMGTLFALARMSEQSEITVMRASGRQAQASSAPADRPRPAPPCARPRRRTSDAWSAEPRRTTPWTLPSTRTTCARNAGPIESSAPSSVRCRSACSCASW